MLALIFSWLTCAQAQDAQQQENGKEILQALERLPHPSSAAEFEAAPHLACMNQGKTLVCWSYAACSFVESEMARLKLPEVRLSVTYPAYCQFVEKARRFVQTKGKSRFSPGDLFTGVMDACRMYGAIPAAAYGPQPSDPLPDHSGLYADLDKLMEEVKRHGRWNEKRVLAQVKRILDRHLGRPPETFTFAGKTYTPQSFGAQVVSLPWNEYVMFTSFGGAPFNAPTELKVPDNWQHQSNYFNLPLAKFYESFKQAVQGGYSVAVSIDISEPAYGAKGRYCFIPDWDIPGSCITQAARDFRFTSGATTDDHAVQVLGYRRFEGQDWFLAKDSWKTVWRDGNQGCLFLHESYVKLKVLAFVVHRAGIASVQQN